MLPVAHATTAVVALISDVLLGLVLDEHSLVLALVLEVVDDVCRSQVPETVGTLARGTGCLRLLGVMHALESTAGTAFDRPYGILLLPNVLRHLADLSLGHAATVHRLGPSNPYNVVHIDLQAHHLASLHLYLLLQDGVDAHYPDLFVLQLLVLLNDLFQFVLEHAYFHVFLIALIVVLSLNEASCLQIREQLLVLEFEVDELLPQLLLGRHHFLVELLDGQLEALAIQLYVVLDVVSYSVAQIEIGLQ